MPSKLKKMETKPEGQTKSATNEDAHVFSSPRNKKQKSRLSVMASLRNSFEDMPSPIVEDIQDDVSSPSPAKSSARSSVLSNEHP